MRRATNQLRSWGTCAFRTHSHNTIQQQFRWRSSLARQRLKERNKRPLPYHRRQALRKVETVRPEKSLSGHIITSVNHPELLEKHINRANALGTKHGVAQQVAEFDTAAAKFPNPPAVVSCTILERSNIIFREMEEWESNFHEVAQRREEELSYEYPKEFWGSYGLEDRDEKKENTKEAAERLGIESTNTQSEMFHDLERYDVDDRYAACVRDTTDFHLSQVIGQTTTAVKRCPRRIGDQLLGKLRPTR
eukprot:gb/GECG01015522.1/.p1 GENE.gb/GECG01015522.1/~~gb/GECG01015522.1/.p1  ORF type:complete len:249 (+),score=27.12 gb/GECG01015522.1/:1-747(+)